MLPEWSNLFHSNYFKVIIPILAGIIPIILKMRTDAQVRALQIITEEIVKINDFVIEFSEVYKKLKRNQNIIEISDIVLLHTLRRKIDYHLAYLENKIKYFPYGFHHKPEFLFSKHIFFNEANTLFVKYQDSLRNDTILDRDIEYFNKYNRISPKYTHLKEVNYDDMIDCSHNLTEYLADHILSKTSHTFRLFMKKIIQISTKK